MAITVDNTAKTVTISGTSEASPQSISSVVDGIVAVDPTNAARAFNTAWIGGTWQIVFATFTDFLIISDGFTLELRASSSIVFAGSLILDKSSTLLVSRLSNLGTGNLATFQNSACKLVTKQNNSINPKVIVNCQNGGRSDLFGSNSDSVLPTHDIQGLDLIFKEGNNGNFKLYVSNTAIIKNINLVQASGTFQFFSTSTVEAGCPEFRGLLFTINGISGDPSNGPRFVKLIKCQHTSSNALSDYNRATYLILLDSVFLNGIPTAYGESGDSPFQAGAEIRFSYGLQIMNEAGSPIQNVAVRFKRNDNAIMTAATNAAGTITQQELVYRQVSNVAGTLRVAGLLTTFTWDIRSRSYGHTQSVEIYDSGEITVPKVKSITMITDPNMSLTLAQANSLAGISIDFVTKNISMTGQSATNLYQYYKAKISDVANYDTPQFMSIAGGTLTLTNGWNLTVTSGPLSGSSIISAIVTNGVFTLQSGATASLNVTDSVRTYYPAAVFSGFPSVANIHGKLPESVFGIKNEVTNVWTTYDASSGSVSVKLSDLGTVGQTLSLVGDAKGYYRTALITSIPLSFTGQSFTNLFEKILNSDRGELYGLGIQAEKDRIEYNATDATFDLNGGIISFNSALDKKEEITSTQSALTTMNTDIIRAMRFNQNPYAKTVQLPLPLKIRANSTTTTAPILLDFNIIEVGNPNGDPYLHSSRPEVQIRFSKIISDPALLANLVLLPALF